MEDRVIFIKGLDVTSMVEAINRIKNKTQAAILSQLETEITDEEKFKSIRKLVLDKTNDFVREIVRTLIGDVEV